jgi:hypothetical protein
MTSANTDFPKQILPGRQKLRILAVLATATILIPRAQAQDSSQYRTPMGNPLPENLVGQIPQQPRFQRLPSFAESQESLAIYNAEGFLKFSPLPSLDDLAGIENNFTKSSSEQDKNVGSDFDRKSVKTEGLMALQRPLTPYEILRKTDPTYSKSEKRDFIEGSWRSSMNLNGLQNTPDPRYLRDWPGNNASWASPAFCYKPLYFEQPNLERYGIGYSCPTNALVSGGKFFADATMLPIHLIKKPPNSCECTLGHRRPGDCTPVQKPIR